MCAKTALESTDICTYSNGNTEAQNTVDDNQYYAVGSTSPQQGTLMQLPYVSISTFKYCEFKPFSDLKLQRLSSVTYLILLSEYFNLNL